MGHADKYHLVEEMAVMNCVLIVDDSDVMRTTIADLFRYFLPQVHVLQARNGQEGVKLAQIEQPDVVLVDGNMPIMDGSATAEHLRHDKRTSHIIVIGMASANTTADVRAGLKQFCHQLIRKPFDLPDLMQQLRQYEA